MFRNILFVCVGNICRSPTAEYWARAQLQKRGLTNITISSAGVHAVCGAPIASTAKKILDRFDIDSSTHIARQINQTIILNAEIIFVMEKWQHERLVIDFPSCRGKMFSLGKWSNEEILDPYQRDQIVFESVFEMIKKNWDLWQANLWNG